MHGPCGSANPTAGCMKEDGKCRFGYPKAFTEQTTESDDNSYPIYRRRNNGRTFLKNADGFPHKFQHCYSHYMYVLQCTYICTFPYVCFLTSALMVTSMFLLPKETIRDLTALIYICATHYTLLQCLFIASEQPLMGLHVVP
jgi:hypothetical protein